MLIISTSPSPYLAPLQLMPCTHPPLFYLANTGPVEFREQFDANFFNSTGLNDGHTDNGELDFDFLLYNENAKEDSAGEDTRYARLARICKVRVCVCVRARTCVCVPRDCEVCVYMACRGCVRK